MKTQYDTNESASGTLTNYSDFAVQPFAPANRVNLGALKSELVDKLESEFAGLETHRINQAVNEAYALASLTAVPQLVLPVLAEEKVRALRDWTRRQQTLLHPDSVTFSA